MSAWQFARLDSDTQTLALASCGGRLPFVVHWGRHLAMDDDLQALAATHERALGRAMLDHLPELSLCPEDGWGFPGHPGLRGVRADGSGWLTRFQLVSMSGGGETVSILGCDDIAGLEIGFRFELKPASGVIESHAKITNVGADDYRLDWLSAPVMPAPGGADDMIGFAGQWCGEFDTQRVPWRRGQHVRENRLGRTSHEHFPGLLVPLPGCTETAGHVYGFHLGWSGNHRLVAEELADGRRMIQYGEYLLPGEVSLRPGESYSTPVLFAAASTKGINGLSHEFHGHVRHHIVRFPDRTRPRPVHYNGWEAVYFDHDLDVLKDLADRAARIGAERYVLDDGWFGRRDDDTSALGDWNMDERKYPDGLKPLIDHVNGLGMAFGLWVEPEMINADSDLFRAHPDWHLHVDPYPWLTGRNQLVLDLTRAEVSDHVFNALDALLDEFPIDYLKWDMNRSLTLAGSAGRPAVHRQTRAVYALIDRIRSAHPHVEIESCASGGARIDYEILKRTHRVWLSDSNDAHERWRMQNVASIFLPPEIVGSHVGPRTCHTSGRRLSMPFRAAVAMSGHMGIEMDLRELTAEEEADLSRLVAFYKSNRGLLHGGCVHRLETAGHDMIAQTVVGRDGDRFLVFAGQTVAQTRQSAPILRMSGLDPDAVYRVRLCEPLRIPEAVNKRLDFALSSDCGVSLSGMALMETGIALPNAFPDMLWILEGERLPDQ